MDDTQFKKFLEIQEAQQKQLKQMLQLMTSQITTTPKSTSTEDEVKRIIINFKCEKYDSMVPAETFLDYFEAQCRMWGVDKKPNDINYLNTKRELFLTCLKPDTYKQLKIAFANVTPKFEEQTYKEISKKFLNLFQIKTTRFKALTDFWNYTRLKNQTFENYANKLKEIANHCGYEGDMLDRQLRDRFATGLNHKRLEIELKQKWPDLKTETNEEITFFNVFEIAQAREIAEKDYVDDDEDTGTTINKVKSKRHNFNSTYKQRVRVIHNKQCKRCGNTSTHLNDECKATKHTCTACNTVGHFESLCIKTGKAKLVQNGHFNRNYSKKYTYRKQNYPKIHKMTNKDTENDSESDSSENIFKTAQKINRSKKINVIINGINCTMDWDPGASHSIINYKLWNKIGKPLVTKAPKLKAYGNFKLQTRGQTKIYVTLDGYTKKLPVIIIDNADPMLFGLSWSEAFKMPFPQNVYSIKCNIGNETNNRKRLETIIATHSDLFNKTLGKIENFKVKLHIKENATPIHVPARPIYFGIQKNVEAELERLLQENILSPVDPNETPIEWATPTVNVPKKGGGIRICGDFRTTINPVMITEKHPVPLFDQLRRQLANGKSFTKIDLKDAYLQFEVDDESKKYLVISTHKGYFCYNRLPFGIANAPALFCRYIEKLLEGINDTAVYFDDIAVTGTSDESHLNNLDEIFKRLRQAGMKVNLKKCTFMEPQIEYLGHQINKDGITPSMTKIQAINNAPTPQNVTELKSFLGLLNFYERFIPNLHSSCADLHTLTRKNVKWNWTTHEDNIFKTMKAKILNSKALISYDENRELFLACDASEKGIGCVLFHMSEDKQEQHIAFASRKLNDSEKQYSVIDREALAIFFAIKKFDQYLRGNKFTLMTDHKPLEHLFGNKRKLSKLVNNRLTRWALYIGEYNYEIVYRQGKTNTVADFLSRFPNKDEKQSKKEKQILKISEQNQEEKVGDMFLTEKIIKKNTNNDPILRTIKQCIESKAWTQNLTENNSAFYNRRNEISLENGILMWQGRIIIPQNLQKYVLKIIHEGHPGIVAMRALSRFYVWWPNIDKEIEIYVQKCRNCQQNRQHMSELPIYSWNIPEYVWERLHMDFAGPFEGKYWLIVVDALSKWADVKPLHEITTKSLCNALDDIFTQFGLPRIIVSDNGRQFTSENFRTYCERKGIRHITSSPYHPRTNGLAERFVRTFKTRMASSRNDNKTQIQRLRNFLFNYRNTPHNTTNKSPNEMIFGRRLTTTLDNIKPNLKDDLRFKNIKQEIENERLTKNASRNFSKEENVYVRTNLEKQWTPAKIIDRTNRYSYKLRTSDGIERRRHSDHIRQRDDDAPYIDNPIRIDVQPNITTRNTALSDIPEKARILETRSEEDHDAEKNPTPDKQEIVPLRRSSRIAKYKLQK